RASTSSASPTSTWGCSSRSSRGPWRRCGSGTADADAPSARWRRETVMTDGDATHPIAIRAVTATDAADVRALRLEALRDSPRAFGTSVEEEEARTLEQTAARIEPGPGSVLLGAFANGRLVGMVGLRREDHAKEH